MSKFRFPENKPESHEAVLLSGMARKRIALPEGAASAARLRFSFGCGSPFVSPRLRAFPLRILCCLFAFSVSWPVFPQVPDGGRRTAWQTGPADSPRKRCKPPGHPPRFPGRRTLFFAGRAALEDKYNTWEPLNKSSAAEQRIFFLIHAEWKTGNTRSIPLFSILLSEKKSLAVSSCRFNQSFPCILGEFLI